MTITPIKKTRKLIKEINFKLLIPLFLNIKISSLVWNLMKKNCVAIKMIKGKISNITDGKFKTVKSTGYPSPILSLSLKNFNSSNIFIIKISDEKIKKT